MDETDVDVNKNFPKHFAVQRSNSQTRERLQGEYEDICQELRNIHVCLQSRQTDCPPRGIDEGQNSLIQILQVKEMKLKGEIAALKEKEIIVETDPELLEALLDKELSKNVQQLEETLQVVKTQRKEISQDLDRERELLRQHTEVQTSLKSKIELLEQDKENIYNGVNQLRELTRKQKAANTKCMQLMRSLAQFMSEHFPMPTAENIKEAARKNSQQPLDPKGRLLSLQQIIEILMNRMYESPHDPYIELKPYHWLPYIELLLRCGIAQRHPSNCNLVRMVAFNR